MEEHSTGQVGVCLSTGWGSGWQSQAWASGMGTRQELGERREEHREKELMPGKRAGGLLALTRQLPCAEALKVLILQKPQEVHEGGVTP